MLRKDVVDVDVDLLHVERSLFIFGGFHLYSCYRRLFIYLLVIKISSIPWPMYAT
jgi:hypothetical protein